ncbi:hypothetical protein N9917_02445 [Deltaproteobacteria bacterium]|nr:hypothetical protein [Deltaproteobacteria bacterium]
MSNESSKNQVENNFKYHKPVGNQAEKYTEIRSEAKNLASLFLLHCPDSRARSLALTKIEEAVMWANASIARNSNGD